MDKKIKVENGKTINYKLWAEAGGKEMPEGNYQLTHLSFIPKQKVLIEELTSNQNTDAILGIVALDFLKAKYKDKVIPVVVHDSFNGALEEPMAYDAYLNLLKNLIPVPCDEPLGYINRNHIVKPMVLLDTDTTHLVYTTLAGENKDYGYETALLKELERGTYADVNVTGRFTDETSGEYKIYFKSEYTFAKDVEKADFGMIGYLIEQDVHKEYDGYAQGNYYHDYKGYYQTSDGLKPGMGGYENKEEIIPPAEMYYQDVIRLVIGAVDGQEGIIPASIIKAGDKFTLETDIDFTDQIFPSPIHNTKKVYLAIALIDRNTKEVVNANITPISLGDPEGIFTTAENTFSITPFKTPQGCEVIVITDKPQTVSVQIIDMTGKIVAAEKNYVEKQYNFNFNENLAKGTYLIKARTGRKVIIKKIFL